MLNSGLQSRNKIIIKKTATPRVDLTARGVACFCVRSSLLSARKNDIIGVTNIFKEADCVGSIYDNSAQELSTLSREKKL